jgi:hypothetical protein
VTSIDGGNVVVDWSEPEDNGSPIIGYSIYLRQSDNVTYSIQPTDCDGSQQDMVTATQCSIPIDSLRISPFNLNWGSNIYAKVIGYNVYGNSALSDAGSEAIILTKPNAPINVAEIVISRSITSISFDWDNGPSDGGAPVIDYRINFDQALDTFVVRATGVTALSYTATGLTAGLTYKFTIEARNSYGYSDPSTPVSIICATIPAVPATP